MITVALKRELFSHSFTTENMNASKASNTESNTQGQNH